MSADDLVQRRLVNQQMAGPRFAAVADLVRWMGAVQAQDYPGSLWAIGQRLAGAVEEDVEAAVASRAIVRTWPMRRTLHFVAAADVRWMLALLAPRLASGNVGRYRQLELEAKDFARARKIFTRSLGGSARLTRPAAYEALARGGVSPAGQRGIHIVAQLAQEGLICFGPREGKQPTLVLLEDWVPSQAQPSREEALARLATAYIRSHGPATLADFAWWAGLSMRDARAGIHDAGPAGEVARPRPRPSAALLPPWDEYLVAYKDRGHALGHLDADPPPMVIGNAVVVINGRVRGTWRRAVSASAVEIRISLWSKATEDERRLIRRAAARYGRFLGKDVTIV